MEQKPVFPCPSCGCKTWGKDEAMQFTNTVTNVGSGTMDISPTKGLIYTVWACHDCGYAVFFVKKREDSI